MANLKCFAIAGMKLWFWSDDHEPPHFHAKRNGKWEYKVNFLKEEFAMFEIKWSITAKTLMSKQDRKKLVAMVVLHRVQILQEWEKLHP